MACESTTTTSGLNKDVLYYHSSELRGYCINQYGDEVRALKNAVTYTEGAFDDTGHTVTADYSTHDIQVNDQCWNQNETFQQEDPCTGNVGEWKNPHEYFKRYINCKDMPVGDDVTLFLTNCDNTAGGLGGSIAWVNTGQNVADLPTSFSSYGTTAPFAAMQTVLHELGHEFMVNSCVNDNYSEHHYGRLGEYGFEGQDYYMTPMGKWDDASPSENACCQDHYEQGDKYYRMSWSDCCLATWEC